MIRFQPLNPTFVLLAELWRRPSVLRVSCTVGGMLAACWDLKAGAKLQARLTISSNSHWQVHKVTNLNEFQGFFLRERARRGTHHYFSIVRSDGLVTHMHFHCHDPAPELGQIKPNHPLITDALWRGLLASWDIQSRIFSITLNGNVWELLGITLWISRELTQVTRLNSVVKL